jgi:hypothetical protein
MNAFVQISTGCSSTAYLNITYDPVDSLRTEMCSRRPPEGQRNVRVLDLGSSGDADLQRRAMSAAGLEEGRTARSSKQHVTDAECGVVSFIPAPGEQEIDDGKSTCVNGQASGEGVP